MALSYVGSWMATNLEQAQFRLRIAQMHHCYNVGKQRLLLRRFTVGDVLSTLTLREKRVLFYLYSPPELEP